MRVNITATSSSLQPGVVGPITESPGDSPQAGATVTTAGSKGQPDAASMLRGLGMEPTPEMKQSAKILLDSGVSLNKKAVQDLKEFMGKALGSMEQKLETVQALADKKIEVTAGHLRAVHEALHGQPLSGALNDLAQAGETGLESAEASTNKLMGKSSDLEKTMKTIRERLASNPRIPPQVAEKLSKVLYEAAALQQTGKEGEARQLMIHVIQQLAVLENSSLSTMPLPATGAAAVSQGRASEAVNAGGLSQLFSKLKVLSQQGASLEELLNQYQDQLRRQPQLNGKAASRVEQALEQAVTLQQMGWEQVGREQILKLLDQAAGDLVGEPTNSAEAAQSIPSSGVAYEDQAGMSLAPFLTSKELVVTQFTQRMNEAAAQFQSAKREIVKYISNVIQVAEINRTQSQAAVKPLLESTIDLLDKAILKSEMMMLTDMETEKELIRASGDLAEAKRLLARGEHVQALTVLKEVKGKLDAMNWRPSDVRIQHFATGQSLFADKIPAAQVFSQVAETAQHFQSHPPSARNMFEFIRALGLNYESDLADSHKHQQQRGREENPHNLKTALLQLAKAGERTLANGKVSLAAEQVLQNLTGQQLLSKPEAGNQPQNMFMQLPLLLENGLENVKMYVQSKNEGQKVDWENCSLYFLIETKKMGQTGIHIQAVERNLSITIKNDQPQFKQQVESLVTRCKDSLAEIGYNVIGVTFTQFTEQKKEETEAGRPSPVLGGAATSQEAVSAAKGLDLKI
ncbi:hypothetical protein NDK47_24935 [Brevibacillus ruminantium]|uniref:Flagellar hook-length control protein FliK n=1 Tax=Brevibacillus ruminantium TaxID=2950604 RepID=A0ABY4WDQ3_9BACL|nr:hypothetical protein [Brevibacillus ruminantium]USG65315.1 hypothetical protein NDK47_24935 [Brevibacillus ruminantium]